MSSSNEARSRGKEKGSLARQLVLALVLGLLGVLLVIMTANAYVAVKIHDTLEDFDRGTFNYTGLLDLPPHIESVQLLPIGLTGEWMISTQRLPMALSDVAAAINGRVIYVVGGSSLSAFAHDVVYYSIIMGYEGTLTPWEDHEEERLPEPRAGAAIAIHPGDEDTSTLYVVGGFGSDLTAKNTVYRAQVDDTTGAIIGGWTTDAQLVPQPLAAASALVFGDALYVMGGFDGINAFDTVYYAQIYPDGSLGPFSEDSDSKLPRALWDGYAVAYQGDISDTIYYIGGVYIEGADRFPTQQVYFADILPGGGLTDWTPSEGEMPRPLYALGGALINQEEIIVTGGIGHRLDQTEVFTSSVKAALVDPDNPSFRLFNWCDTVPNPEQCEFGAWQTGDLMPEVRSQHGSVAGGGYVYVLGGQDTSQDPTDTVFYGKVNGAGALYAPTGQYLSQRINLEQEATFKKLEWVATISQTDKMSLTMQYRTSHDGQQWSPWSPKTVSQHGINSVEPAEPPTNIHFVQYQVGFTTVLTYNSPRLDKVLVYYEVEDPDVSVIKDTGTEITVSLGTTLQYTIHYTNTGGWVAENVVLTETLDENTTYAGDSDWHQVGSSNVYTHSVDDVERGADGSTTFKVRVNDQVPPGTYTITNRVEIDYPPMIDAFEQTIVDPNWDDNWFEFDNPLGLTAITVTKEAIPAAEGPVTPGSFITYTIRYTNLGNIRAGEAVLTDTFGKPGDYEIRTQPIPPNAGEHVWNLGDLPPRKTDEVEVRVQLSDPLPNNWPVTNTVSLYSPGAGLAYAEITHTVRTDLGPDPEPMVDLSIADVQVVPSRPVATQWPTFRATVVSSGTKAPTEPFWLELYIKPEGALRPRWPSDHLRGYCLDQACAEPRRRYVEQVMGAQLTELAQTGSTVIPFQNLQENPSPDFPAEGVYDIYIQVDVYFDDPIIDYNKYWGLYPEDREDNNIWSGTLSLEKPRTYLPIILRRAP